MDSASKDGLGPRIRRSDRAERWHRFEDAAADISRGLGVDFDRAERWHRFEDAAAAGYGSPIAIIPTRTPARPSHWMGLSRSPRNSTATTIVTAGPNDDASPTSHVSATSRP